MPTTSPSHPVTVSQKLCYGLTAGFAIVAVMAALKALFITLEYGFVPAYLLIFAVATLATRGGSRQASHSQLAIIMIGYFTLALMQGFSPKVTLVVFVISMGYLLIRLLTRHLK
ncbi:hypothetical protein [Alteromonas sp. AMM-1]|uniref:hypothetical protein n=1 Tax=Alteromonas sp. AMM-1 TaxID=3394233 RepID=UPI0039A60A93